MLALLALACADKAPDLVDSAADPGPAHPLVMDLSWSPCSLFEGEDDGLAECVAVDMPLRWDEAEEDRSFEVYAKRLPAAEPTVDLWLLDGGPGASGVADFPGRMQALQAAMPGAQLYTLDHRGTGLSGRLGCSAEDRLSPSGEGITDEELPDCIAELQGEWGDRLDAVNATESAWDLAGLIASTEVDGRPVLVWGGSYGSYLAQRYLVLQPEQADGVIMEGVFPADSTLAYAEEYTNLAAQEVFARCGQDEVCGGYLGEDPWARLGALMEDIDGGHCTQDGVTSGVLGVIFAYLAYSRHGQSLMPAATYRLERCSTADRRAFLTLYNTLFGSGGSFSGLTYSMLLQHHVSASEMWTHPDFDGLDMRAYYDALYEDALVVKGYGYTRVMIAEEWPTYSEPLDDVLPETDIPVLMLQGALDPVTPELIARGLGEHLSGPSQGYVVFPNSAHGVSFDSPDAEGSHCGLDLMLQFMEDPEAELDTSCVDETAPLDFDPASNVAQYFFGEDSYWD